MSWFDTPVRARLRAAWRVLTRTFIVLSIDSDGDGHSLGSAEIDPEVWARYGDAVADGFMRYGDAEVSR